MYRQWLSIRNSKRGARGGNLERVDFLRLERRESCKGQSLRLVETAPRGLEFNITTVDGRTTTTLFLDPCLLLSFVALPLTCLCITLTLAFIT